jgi:protein phosphatase
MHNSAAQIPIAGPLHSIGQGLDSGRRRTENQDSLAVVDLPELAASAAGLPASVLAVADGVGSRRGAKLASKMAVRTVINYFIEAAAAERSAVTRAAAAHYDDWLQHAVNSANDLIYDCNQRISGHMATTLVFALVIGNSAYIANVGDSRAYLVSRHGLRQLTADHSVTGKLLELNLISIEEARHHPQRNTLTQAIGARAMLVAQCCHTVLGDDEYLLLCSDGLYHELSDSDIQHIIYQSAGPQAACDVLVQAANDAGGRDNIAVTVLGACRH